MTYLAVALVALALGGCSVYLLRAFARPQVEMRPYDDAWVVKGLEAVDVALTRHSERIEETRRAVSEGIERAERIERRIKGTVARAVAELEDGVTPALQAEAEELGLFDGGGGAGRELSPVLPQVGGDQESSVTGVTLEQLQRARFG